MNLKRWVGISLLAAGIVLVSLAHYINERVAVGREEVTEGQEKIDQGLGLFSFTPLTEEIGRSLAAPQQNEVNEGRAEVNDYADKASWIHLSGVIILLLGAVLVILSFVKIKY